MILIALELNSLQLYFQSLMFFIEIAFSLNMTEYAGLLCVSILDIAIELQLYRLMPDLLPFLAEMCRRGRLYHESILFLQKAIEYSWFFDLQRREVFLYDQIGLCFFLQSDTENSMYYHKKYFYVIRSIEVENEPQNSSIRLSCIDYLKRELKMNKDLKNTNLNLERISVFRFSSEFDSLGSPF